MKYCVNCGCRYETYREFIYRDSQSFDTKKEKEDYMLDIFTNLSIPIYNWLILLISYFYYLNERKIIKTKQK